MTPIAKAWDAFLAAIAEANELNARGAAAESVRDLLRHARELLDIIEDEADVHGLTLPMR